MIIIHLINTNLNSDKDNKTNLIVTKIFHYDNDEAKTSETNLT